MTIAIVLAAAHLTVMSWNTEHYAFWRRPVEQQTLIESNMFAVCRAVNPDILLIQETYGAFDRFRAALPNHPHARLLGACNSVYSRYPIVAVHDTYREPKLYGCTNGWNYAKGETGPFTFGMVEIDIDGRRVRACPVAMNWQPCPVLLPDDLDAAGLLADEAGPQPNGGLPRPTAIRRILDSIRPMLNEAERIPVLIGGDFNSHSHLDWTKQTMYHFGHNGRIVDWPVSKTMLDEGFVDTYRMLHPDPMSCYGTSFPRSYADKPESTCYARIDFIYFKGSSLKPVSSDLFGATYHEPFEYRGVKYTCFPSDHAFQITEFEFTDKR